MRTVRLTAPGADHPVDVSIEGAAPGAAGAYTVTVGGRRMDVEIAWIGDHAAQMRVHGRVLPVRVLRSGAGVTVWLAGRTWHLELADRTARRVSEAAAAGLEHDLTAPMPGRVLRINADAGDEFAAHEALILLESMKMEMSISVPEAGRIREMLCAEGELVEMGQLLARLEPADAAARGSGAGDGPAP